MLWAFATIAGGEAPRRSPPIPDVPGKWSHVEINRKIGKRPHTLILDRGRIIQAVRDADHDPRARISVAVIPLSPQTLVVIDRPRATPTTCGGG